MNRWAVSVLNFAKKQTRTIYPARWQRLLFPQSSPSARGRPSRTRERRLCARRVGKGCYLHDRGRRHAADHRDQVRGDTPPGALAKAVISTIEAVGTPPTIANKGASNQLDCCSAPGALAKAVICTTEAVGTRATDANKGAQALCLTNGGWGDKIRIYIFI